MSDWGKKRFWKDATVESVEDGFTVRLDSRELKTPAKASLVVPTRAMADAIAAEWRAQDTKINPMTMPTTRSANAAIDKVTVQHSEVADMLAEYGGSDLLCYRATTPEALIDRQAAAWDPMLDWAEATLGVRLKTVSGVMHEAQNNGSLVRLNHQVHALNAFELAAFHDLVSLSGSLVLGFAAVHKFLPIEDIWQCSRVDENWQEEHWGEDDEANALTATKHLAFLHADLFYKMSQK